MENDENLFVQLENLENSDSANQSEESAKVNCSNKCPFRYCSAPPSAAVGRRIRKLEEQINLNYQSYGVGQNVWKGEVRNLFGDEVPQKRFWLITLEFLIPRMQKIPNKNSKTIFKRISTFTSVSGIGVVSGIATCSRF